MILSYLIFCEGASIKYKIEPKTGINKITMSHTILSEPLLNLLAKRLIKVIKGNNIINNIKNSSGLPSIPRIFIF